MWYGVVDIIPRIIVAIIIFILGWYIAIGLERLVARAMRAIKLDDLLRQTGLDEALHKAGFKLNSGLFIGALVKWFFIILALKLALGVVGLVQVDLFLQSVLNYIPSVLIAVLILFAGSIIASALSRVVDGSARAAGLTSGNLLSTVTYWAIWIFTILVALTQLNIAADIIQTLVIGLVAMLALAGGLAFGLGGRDAASRAIERARDRLSHHTNR